MDSTDPNDSIDLWVQLASAGDQTAQTELWDRFFPQLLRLARTRLQGRALRIGDEEDVVISVFQSFFRGAEENRFPDLRGRDNLWRLLSRMTQRKAIDWLRHTQRLKRLSLGESAIAHGDTPLSMADLPGNTRNPMLEVIAIEECRRLMEILSPELRLIVMLKFDGFTNQEISFQQKCSLATIERRLKLIREIWSDSEHHE
jgi:RNA polymerase sigma factor (sigma-70 family)